MTDLDINLAPGCFGSALTYIEGSVECTTCQFAARCKPQHEANLAALREQLGVTPRAPRRKHVRTEKPTEELTPAAIPKKVEELLERIEAAGIKIAPAFAVGRNPFDSRFPFLRVTAHLLLHLPSLDRTMLVMALEKKLGWGRLMATAHAIQAFQLFVAVGVAVEANDALTLKR